ncbi:hypothetical protein ABZP36_004357 [Zizania latifolia]
MSQGAEGSTVHVHGDRDGAKGAEAAVQSKEREDSDHLHMVGVRDKDKALLLKDPALNDMKLRAEIAA